MFAAVACTAVYILIANVSRQTVNLLYNVFNFLHNFYVKDISVWTKWKRWSNMTFIYTGILLESIEIYFLMTSLHKITKTSTEMLLIAVAGIAIQEEVQYIQI